MDIRNATTDDVPAVAAVHRAFETSWFGEAETDEDEAREWLDLADVACVLLDEAGVAIGTGRAHRTGSDLLVNPAVDTSAAYRRLFAWLTDAGARETDALDRDEALVRTLADAAWTHTHSSFELMRSLDGWTPAQPAWPDGVAVREGGDGDAATLYRFVYEDAGWADVAGHNHRPFDEWQRLFVTHSGTRIPPLLAEQDGRIVGAAILRLFGDGMGWVAQLAVAQQERGRGLGRALLLAGFHRLITAGATKLGLSVQASNRAALSLYLDAGLVVDREWQTWSAP